MTIQHLFPIAKPTLDLNFAGERSLDPRITFSRSSIGTYVDEDGIIRYAAEDEPRFEYDGATGESLGLLIEEARTNAILYSTAPDAEFTQDSSNFTYTFNQPAPDGSNDAYLMENVSNTSSNRGGYFVNAATIPTTGKITVSVFVKPIGGQVIALGGSPGNGGYYGVPLVKYDFTVSPPVPSKTSSDGLFGFTAEPFIQEIGNGWYRLIEVIDLTNGTSFLTGRTNGPRVSNTTPGTSTVVWGYQIETGSFATSYIPTTGTAEDRDPDNCTIEGFDSWYNQTEGSFTYDVNVFGRLAGIAELRVGTNSGSRGQFMRRGSKHRMTLNGGNAQVNGQIDYPIGFIKLAYRMQPGDHQQVINGAIKNSYAGGNFGGPIPLYNRMWIGRSESLTEYLNGHMVRIAYYSHPLSDEQLEALT